MDVYLTASRAFQEEAGCRYMNDFLEIKLHAHTSLCTWICRYGGYTRPTIEDSLLRDDFESAAAVATQQESNKFEIFSVVIAKINLHYAKIN